MLRSPRFITSQQRFQSTRGSGKAASGVTAVTDFLRAHDKMAALLPAVSRIMTLQKDCASILPALFDACSVVQFEAGQLVVATPNAALASRLKQQLPKLQEGLLKRGWQVNAIRIKVQVGNISKKEPRTKKIVLPAQALSALDALHGSLEESQQNHALKEALANMIRHHRGEK